MTASVRIIPGVPKCGGGCWGVTIGEPRIYKPLVIIIAPLTVRFGLCWLFRASGELRIAIINHGLKRFPVMNCGSVTGGDFLPIPGSTYSTQEIVHCTFNIDYHNE